MVDEAPRGAVVAGTSVTQRDLMGAAGMLMTQRMRVAVVDVVVDAVAVAVAVVDLVMVLVTAVKLVVRQWWIDGFVCLQPIHRLRIGCTLVVRRHTSCAPARHGANPSPCATPRRTQRSRPQRSCEPIAENGPSNPQ